MPVTSNLQRFGPDWAAVGRLINGELPDNDDERWQMLAAPEYRIRSLLSRHSTAQAVLRACLGSGLPFALFLRSFASEAHWTQEGQIFASHFVTDSVHFQRAIRDLLNARGIPLVKLHGGSDPLFSQCSYLRDVVFQPGG